MHTTKTDILALLKRSDGATVDELASALDLASMTVRQHLATLERDGLVRSEEVRRQTGRPHYVYRLTAEGHGRLAQGYDRLLGLIVEAAARLEAVSVAETSAERRRRLFERAAATLAERYRPEVQVLTGAARIGRAAEILRDHGGFADWHHADGGAFELRDYGCVFRACAPSGGSCAWHETFLSSVLGSGVRAAATESDRADCCTYVIAAATVAALNRG